MFPRLCWRNPEYLIRLRGYAEREAQVLEGLQGPAPDLRGTHRFRLPGEREEHQVSGTFSHGTDAQGRAALILTDRLGTEHVVRSQLSPVLPLPTPQQAADACREQQRRSMAGRLDSLRSTLAHQQRRYDAWQPRELLPLTGSPQDRAARAAERAPRPLTKKQQAEARFQATFREKYGREPIWTSWQTTNNNPALFAFGHLISSYGRHPDGSFAGYAPEHLTRPLTRAASQVMNLAGMDAFLAWASSLLGAPVHWHERRREFQTAAGQDARYVADFAGSLDAAHAVLARPGPAPESYIPAQTPGPSGEAQAPFSEAAGGVPCLTPEELRAGQPVTRQVTFGQEFLREASDDEVSDLIVSWLSPVVRPLGAWQAGDRHLIRTGEVDTTGNEIVRLTFTPRPG